MDEDLARLCQSCGLCCDGSLFGRVALEPDEILVARKRRLRVLASGKGFEQPCAALAALGAGESRTCSIYLDRPRSCRRFVCRLHERHRREGGPLEARLAPVRRVREILAYLEASGLTSQDFEGDDPPEASASLAELMRRLEEDFARA
jgi:Fe-S-cluster containining protein